MATTTNYGWTTPDDTALVKDGASAIRSLGTAVDTTTKALNPSTTLGDIEYRSSTANTNTRLGIGSTGQVLTVAGGVPSWATAPGGGKVLQVVQGTYSTATTIASATFTDTGLSATITPSSTTSKILVLVSQQFGMGRAETTLGYALKILRGATDIFNGSTSYQTAYFYLENNTAFKEVYNYTNYTYLDSPSSTSALTYKTQGRAYLTANSGYVAFQVASATSTITLLEIGA